MAGGDSRDAWHPRRDAAVEAAWADYLRGRVDDYEEPDQPF